MSYEQAGCSRRGVLKGLAAGTALCALGDLAGGRGAAAAGGGGRLPRATPEAVGIDPAGVLGFVEAVEQKVGGLHSFMLLRRGAVAAEGWWAPYAPRHPHMLYSLSKSFTSTAVGLAVSEGRLTVDAPVTSFFAGDLPATIGEHLAAMRVRHLLTMSTGHAKDATGPTTAAPDGNWARAFLALPVEHEPGTHFVYNSAATYMLSAIVQKLTGLTVLDYLQSRLFEPLGIEGETWETCPRGINTGGWGLKVKTEDIARFGQLYLQHGQWQGRRVIPEEWVADATRKHIANGTSPTSDWAQGYGYQFWRCRHGAFRGDGAFGQFCVVLPQQEAVLAVTSGLGDMQAVLDCAWDHLLPAMSSGSLSGASSSGGSSSGGDAALRRKLAGLTVRPPEGRAASHTASRVSGRTFHFDPNGQHLEALTPTFHGSRCAVSLREGGREHRLACGAGEWVHGTAPLLSGVGPHAAPAPASVAARGAWTDDDTYTMKLCFYETPYVRTDTWKFSGDQVTVTSRMNVGFGPTERPPVNGRSG